MRTSNKEDKNEQKTKMTSKQLVAIIGIVLLVLMYVIALVAAFLDTGNGSSGTLFKIALTATVFIPLLIWIYIWMYGQLTNKKTMADFNIFGEDQENTNTPVHEQIPEVLTDEDNNIE